MPAGSPFTALCRQLARADRGRFADLHVHTTASDGSWTPSQVVEKARAAGLPAVAITDHDTLAGVQQVAPAAHLVPGVEITAEFHGREVHILGLFVDPHCPELNATLAPLVARRRERFVAFVEQLSRQGVPLRGVDVERHLKTPASLGRRNLANLIVGCGRAANVFHAIRRYLMADADGVPPKLRRPVGEACRLIRGAGGISSLAHPPADFTFDVIAELQRLGLQAVEAECPSVRGAGRTRLRGWAGELGLLVTGGSDSHGPEPGGRAVGSAGVRPDELDRLRAAARVVPGG